jgi:hypothetical protein
MPSVGRANAVTRLLATRLCQMALEKNSTGKRRVLWIPKLGRVSRMLSDRTEYVKETERETIPINQL